MNARSVALHFRSRLVVVLLALLACAPAAAAERILSYDSDVQVNADGSLDVTETLRVQADGDKIRRGIYRDFPTRYKDRFGNRVVVGFEVLGVQRNGATEPFFTERVANGVRVNTGNDDLLPVPAEQTYTLRYRTTRQLGFFDAHDELYWNAIGQGWLFPIEAGSVRVRLPRAVDPASLQVDGWSGPQGARQRDFSVAATAGGATWTLTRALPPGSGLTVLLGFPKGLVHVPTRAERVRALLMDNLGVLVALAGLLAMLGYGLRAWLSVGRDPPEGTLVVRYAPPQDMPPGAARFLARMGYDDRCFSADLLALAVAGQVRIHRQDRMLLADKWSLERTDDRSMAAPEHRALLEALVPVVGTTLAFDNTQASRFQAARSAHAAALEQRLVPSLFARNSLKSWLMIGIGALFFVPALVVSQGAGLLAIIAIGVLMLVAAIVAAWLMKAPSPEGQRVRDAIAGFKRYLSVADRDDLARLQGPDPTAPALDAQRFEQLLPYAVALQVEDAWTRRFTAAVGAAAADAAMANTRWYSGGRFDSVSQFTSAVGSGLNSQISSASTPPGSSSGGGGGGSSGGGGGGGGGGGR